MAIVASLFAVPPGLKAIFDFVREYAESQQFQPDTRVIDDEAPMLEMWYRPVERRLTLAVELTLHNQGKSEDIVAAASARLDAPQVT